MSLDWYPFFVVDYRRDTYHLTLEQDAAYRRLIDEYMLTREPLPNNDAALARIVGITTAEWESLAPVVRRFFRAKNDKLHHKRCEDELRKQSTRTDRYRARAKKGGEAKALKDKALRAFSMLNPATIQDKDITTTSEFGTARERLPERYDVASPALVASESSKRRN